MKEINVIDLRKKFGEVLDEVRYKKEPVIVKKNGRQIVVLMDIEVFRAAQGHLQEEAFIEEYSDERIKEFLEEDRLDRDVAGRVRKTL